MIGDYDHPQNNNVIYTHTHPDWGSLGMVISPWCQGISELPDTDKQNDGQMTLFFTSGEECVRRRAELYRKKHGEKVNKVGG